MRDLTGAYLDGANLEYASFCHTMIPRGTTLINATLVGANLTGANLNAANLTGADFTDARIAGANSSNLWYEGGTGLTPAQLSSTASYKAKDLRGIRLDYNDLNGWKLANQNLTGASFQHANLANADLADAEISEANFAYTSFTAGQLTSTASYKRRDLHGVNLSYNDLRGFDLAGQNLTDGTFVGATLTGADFTSATLTGVNFSWADLRGAKGLAASQLSDTNTANAIRPDGTVAGLHMRYATWSVRDCDEGIPIRILEVADFSRSENLKFVLRDGTWESTISFEAGIPVTLAGNLRLDMEDGVDVGALVGSTFQLFDWTGVSPTGRFNLVSDLQWDTSRLYTTGEVTLVPEPAGVALLALGATALLGRRSRRVGRVG